jgi:hypothetical protein
MVLHRPGMKLLTQPVADFFHERLAEFLSNEREDVFPKAGTEAGIAGGYQIGCPTLAGYADGLNRIAVVDVEFRILGCGKERAEKQAAHPEKFHAARKSILEAPYKT